MIFGRVSEHFTNLRHVKRWKTRVFGLNALFRGTEVVKHPICSIGLKMMFGSVSYHFANLRHVRRWKSCLLGPKCTIFGVPKLWSLQSTLLDPKWCFSVFCKASAHKRCKTSVSGLNALFPGTKVVKHPFLSIGPKMMFGSVSKHFANLRHVECWKTRVSGLNALFRGTKVAKHPFYPIGHKLIFGWVLVHFANLRRVKDEKLVFQTWMHY
jgi:hypothetical protein